MSYERLATIPAVPGTSLEAVQSDIDSIWAELREDPKQAAVLPVKSPFHVGRDEAQFDIATTILISIAGSLGKEAIQAAWVRWIWPELRRRLGISEGGQANAGAD